MTIPPVLLSLWDRSRYVIIACILLITLFILFFWNSIIITIHSGELGVKYCRFWGGTQLEKPVSEGLHFIWPFDIIHNYDMRIQEQSAEIQTLTDSGLTITVSVSCQYQLMADRLPLFHQQVGPTYREKIILPMMRTVVRQVVGSYTSDDLYTNIRQQLEDLMMVKAVSSVGRLPITIHNFVIKAIEFPAEVREAIVQKAITKQEYQRYQYVILKTQEEARRKSIEAEGIRNFQNIVNSGMTENYLRYEGIQATLKLAQSANAKVVIAGGRDSLPLLLNIEDKKTPAAPAPDAAGSSAAEPTAASGPTAADSSSLSDALNLPRLGSAMQTLWQDASNLLTRPALRSPDTKTLAPADHTPAAAPVPAPIAPSEVK